MNVRIAQVKGGDIAKTVDIEDCAKFLQLTATQFAPMRRNLHTGRDVLVEFKNVSFRLIPLA